MTESSQPTRYQIGLQIFALVVVSVFAVVVGGTFDEQMQNYMPETKSLASTFNKKPSGESGLLELASRVGLSSRQWLSPYRRLPTVHGMLVIIAPSQSLAEFETQQILNWVASGNDLVYLDHFSFEMTRKLLERLDVHIKDDTQLNDIAVPVDATKPEFNHVKSLVVTADTNLRGGQPIVAYKDQTIFSVLKHGKGRILIGTAPNLCTNRRLSDNHNWPNFQFLINWMSTTSGEIFFDERCHGFTESGNVWVVLAHSPLGPVSAQLLLMLIVACYSCSKRFGAIIEPSVVRKISNLEFINGLSNAYRRARANSAVLEITSHPLKQKICKIVGISAKEPTDKIIEQWQQFFSTHIELKAPEDVPKLLEDLDNAIAAPNVNDSLCKSLLQRMDKTSLQVSGLLTDLNNKG